MSSNRIAVSGSRLTDPALLGNLACRYIFSDPATLTQATNGTGAVPGNGNPVGYAFDQSGNGYDINAASTGARPTWESNVRGTIGAALFDGSDDLLARLAVSNVAANRAAMTIYGVVDHTVAPTGREPYMLFSTGGGNATRFEHNASGASPNKIATSCRRANADALTIATGTTDIGSGIRLVTAQADYANDTLTTWMDTVLEATAAIGGTSGANCAATNGRIYVGSQGTVFFQGYMFELMMFWEAHNADQRSAVWHHLRNKYLF